MSISSREKYIEEEICKRDFIFWLTIISLSKLLNNYCHSNSDLFEKSAKSRIKDLNLNGF